MNVVVVSDEPVLAELIARPLTPLGHQVSRVASAAELLDRLGELTPRAALLPRRLPDGVLADVVAALRDGPTPVAAIVVGVAAADRAIARDLDADGFLLVPFSDAEVVDVLGAGTRARKLVLLADDSPLIHRHTVPILEDEGYEVVSAYDGAEALALARARQPDLVITDVEMPQLDGYGVCKGLKADPATAHVPVLICSSLGEAADLERGFDAGADDYLVKPVVPEELATRVRALAIGATPSSRERILVVDDSPAQRHYVADCLSRQGFDVATAENGRVALDKAQALRPALIVSDYEMPEMTGFELVHAVRRDPELRQTPVIMLTARDSKRDMAQMRAAGASAYLVKPFSQDKCVAMVERTLAERRLLAYKEASSLFISEGARHAAEERAAVGALHAVRADEREVTVMFSDLVGFTPMSQRLDPRGVIELLNAYFDVMCPLIKDLGGDIDKFIGDAIMAIFEERRGREPAAVRATRAALAMQAAMPAFNQGRPITLQMRIGVNTGPVVRGDLGSRVVRRDYTVIGDTVNRANRYETRCPPGEVLVSESTRAFLGDGAVVRAVPGLELKGVAIPVTGWVVERLPPPPEEPS
ncbi:MAG: response regulator [Kofleriaceae bacterium]|nr:response regulator [Myxococcales bacterium]MCB9559070.1 response regulator [Kofleriaceae bacterium]MCB9574837.1 response regulator [Kofleriaceae bacterium]